MQNAFKLSKAHVFIHHQAFYLVEHRRVGLIVVIPVNTTGRNDPQWRLLGFHGANLHP